MPRTTKTATNAPAASDSGYRIVATSQSSRFHTDTLITLSQEIELKQVNISIGANEDLLVDVHLRLKAGKRYGLIGRNGQGKSTLLRAIAQKLIPGIAENMRILLVDQVDESWLTESTRIGDDQTQLTIKDLSVTDRVVKSDIRRERALSEQKLLTRALDSANTSDLGRAVATIMLARSKDELVLAQKIALKRSGARGSEARKQLLKAETDLKEREEALRLAEQDQFQGEPALLVNDLLSEIQATLDGIDASATEAHARSILIGLGFTQEQLDSKFLSLSGGWRSRCSLASALLQKPDLLILDEPVNFLDLRSVIWLQDYLLTFPSTILLVAHDRDFVDATAEEIILLRDKQLTYYEGNLTDYERQTRERYKAIRKLKDTMDRKKEAIEKSIEEGARTARKTGDENRQRMIKSRQKKLDDRWGLERNANGHRFRLNKDLGGFHLQSRAAVLVEEGDPPINLPFPEPEPMRFPGALISAADVSFRYTPKAAYVLEDVNLTIHPGSRVGLVGRNGHGKSTLVRLLVGSLASGGTGVGIKPTKGTIERHPRLRVGYFDQHSVEVLSAPEVVKESALEYFMKRLREDHNPPIEIDEGTARGFLGSWGLGGKRATNPIVGLSGGQKVRLALGLIVYPSPDLFVLDEVSTHLDLDTVNALIRALRGYAGAILLVSHDRHLMRCVVEGAPIFARGEDDEEDESDEDEEDKEGNGQKGVVYMVGPKAKVRALEGGSDEYVEKVRKRKK